MLLLGNNRPDTLSSLGLNLFIFSGSLFLDRCTVQPYIPIYMLVCGSVALICNFIDITLSCCFSNRHYGFLGFLISAFFLVWFILGKIFLSLKKMPTTNKEGPGKDTAKPHLCSYVVIYLKCMIFFFFPLKTLWWQFKYHWFLIEKWLKYYQTIASEFRKKATFVDFIFYINRTETKLNTLSRIDYIARSKIYYLKTIKIYKTCGLKFKNILWKITPSTGCNPRTKSHINILCC